MSSISYSAQTYRIVAGARHITIALAGLGTYNGV